MKWIALLLVLVCFSGCAFVTEYEYFELEQQGDFARDKVWLSVSFRGTEYLESKVPVLFEKSVTRDPYKCYVSLQGVLDQVEVDEVYVLIDNKTRILVPHDSITRTERDRGDTIFALEKVSLDVDVATVKEVQVVADFTGTTQGKGKRYSLSKMFKVVRSKRIGNRFMDRVMSV